MTTRCITTTIPCPACGIPDRYYNPEFRTVGYPGDTITHVCLACHHEFTVKV
jgi:hypothetical protein